MPVRYVVVCFRVTFRMQMLVLEFRQKLPLPLQKKEFIYIYLIQKVKYHLDLSVLSWSIEQC